MSRAVFLCVALVGTLACAGWVNSATAAVPNASCSGCHKKKEVHHTTGPKTVNHAVNLKSVPNVYLEAGKIVCSTCHDGYTLQLTTGGGKHLLTPYARGTLSCETCHNN